MEEEDKTTQIIASEYCDNNNNNNNSNINSEQKIDENFQPLGKKDEFIVETVKKDDFLTKNEFLVGSGSKSGENLDYFDETVKNEEFLVGNEVKTVENFTVGVETVKNDEFLVNNEMNSEKTIKDDEFLMDSGENLESINVEGETGKNDEFLVTSEVKSGENLEILTVGVETVKKDEFLMNSETKSGENIMLGVQTVKNDEFFVPNEMKNVETDKKDEFLLSTEAKSGENLDDFEPLVENLMLGVETDKEDEFLVGSDSKSSENLMVGVETIKNGELLVGSDSKSGEHLMMGVETIKNDEFLVGSDSKNGENLENFMVGVETIRNNEFLVGSDSKSGENLENFMVGAETINNDEFLVVSETKSGDVGEFGGCSNVKMGDEIGGKNVVMCDSERLENLETNENIKENEGVAEFIMENVSMGYRIIEKNENLMEMESIGNLGGSEVIKENNKDEIIKGNDEMGGFEMGSGSKSGDFGVLEGHIDVKENSGSVMESFDSLSEFKTMDEIERKDKVMVDKENVEDLSVDGEIDGKDEVFTDVKDVGSELVIGNESKSVEEGVLGSVPSLDELKALGEGETILVGDESDRKHVGSEVLMVGSDAKSEEADNLPKETEMVVETRVEEEKDSSLQYSPINSPIRNDVELDTEMEAEKESKEGDAMVKEKGISQMQVDDEEISKNIASIRGNGEDENLADTEEADANEVTEEEDKGGKRKRGKSLKISPKSSAKKVIEEDVCFICFDGGNLVLCDRRACPKAYHPSCVNRDEAFFQAKGQWNCGWHLCSICEKKAAHYMCYTCTFSLCKACTKDAVISCVRGNKGFCDACMKTVSLIENTKKVTNEDQLDFDDKNSWLYLFKDYWLSVKQKLSLTSAEISNAKNPYKKSDALVNEQESPEEAVDGSNHQHSSSDSEKLETSKNKRRKPKKRLKSHAKEETSPAAKEDNQPARKLKRKATSNSEVTLKQDTSEWASKELLEFVMHMKNGDRSAISQFDVQALLLEYIKTNKLRDPRRKSQIICDARLQSLFGKPRVGHFEMLKLLESHFLIKENPLMDDNQGTVVDNEYNELDADGTIDATPKGGKDKRLKTRKKGHSRGRQSNLDDYAAIDMHNIGLIFLRRKLVEDLLEEDMFCEKIVGTFVRIRISASTQKQDMYRLVQVLGTSKAAEPYKVGKRTTDFMLEILNLNKKEPVSIDTISNQVFTEEECTRLRQSIKCGLISRLTVGDILDKAMEIQAVRVSDWLESEAARITHLCDRASDLGRRKELRECVDKLRNLNKPDERRRRLEEVPEIHADPNMDPDHESEEHDSEEQEAKQDYSMKPRGSAFSKRGREPTSSRAGNFSSVDSWSGLRQNSGKNYEVAKNLPNTDYSKKIDEIGSMGGISVEGARGYIETQQANMEKVLSPIHSMNAGQSSLPFARPELFTGASSEILKPSLPRVVPDAVINESEKMWHYKDPLGNIQGPFSIVQLRKWKKNGYFPADLKIWKATETEDDTILLTDALDGKFQKQPVMRMASPTPIHTGTNSSSAWGSLSDEVPHSDDKASGSFNPPSPTPNTSASVWNIEQSSETQHPTSSLTIPTPNSAPTNQNGNQTSAGQLISNLENSSAGSLATSGPVGPAISQPAAVTNDVQGWGTQQMVAPYQTAESVPQATVDATAHNQQQAGYNSWVGSVPSAVQNPSESFPMPGYSAIPQQDQWRQPVPANQPTFQGQVQPSMPNVPWGMGLVSGNPNMVWGGYVPGNANMNWAPMVNPGWVAPAANVNQGWVAQPVTPVPPPAYVNPGFGPQAGNSGTNTQAPVPVPGNVNQGWGTGMSPGNSSSGKGSSGRRSSPPGNSGGRGKDGHRGGNRYSVPRNSGGGHDDRPYRRSYDSNGNRICPYFLDGHCKKGNRCDMVHQYPDK